MTHLAIITGASTGIGQAIAAACVDAGYRTLNLSRRHSKLAGVETLSVDLTARLTDNMAAQLRTACQQAETVALIHSAGQIASDSALTTDRDTLESSLAINVVAPALLNQALIDVMPTGSSIVFIGSTLGDKAVGGAMSYVTSKHALNGLMRATCQDLAGRGIHTAVVSPGFTDTAMLREHVGNDPEVLAAIAGGVTQGRLIEPQEIAATVLFCTANPVINGAVIHANLGQIER